MKKKFSFVLVLMLLLFCKEMRAQLPEISSSSLPKWYYIQVTGDGDRVDRVFTAEESAVSGRSLDSTLLDQQLWRFESWGSYYVIINKAEGKKLDIIYDSGRGINHAVVNDSPSSMWKLEAMTSTAGYNITATTPPSEKTNAIYAHQANSGGSRDYVVMFETSTWKNALNSTFNFVEYNEPDCLWYYIQVVGESDRAGLVYTQEGDYVYGREINDKGDLSDMDKQLWRFENLGDSYAIFNKATGKKLDIVYNADKGINVAALSDTVSTNWLIETTGTANCYNITAQTPVSEKASHIYSHQANNYDSRNYMVMFETSGYKNNVNSLYRFVYCEYPVPEISTAQKEVWYFIASKKPGFESRVITDVTDQNWANVKFSLNEMAEGDFTQQWKIVAVSNSEVQFVNRSTGNIILTDATYNTYFYALSAPFNSNANGWTMKYIGSSQYEVGGLNTNGSIVYMNAASDDSETDTYMDDNNLNSGFAWSFKKVLVSPSAVSEEITTTVTTGMFDEIATNIRIGVLNRKIYVEGTGNYCIRNISGVIMNPDTELQVGVYLVTADGKTTKILVK